MRAVRYSILSIFLIYSGLPAESMLSSKGLGLPAVYTNTSSLGMGGLSIAKADGISLNLINPASLYQLTQTTFSIQEVYESTSAKDNSYNEKSVSSDFNGFSFYIPFGKKTGLQLGIRPETHVDYDMTYKGNVSDEAFTKTITGSGGLNVLSIGTFYEFSPKLILGITGQFLFGKIEDYWVVNYDNTNFLKSKNLLSTHMQGENITVGIMSELTSRLSIGAVYRPKITLDSETDETSANRSETITHSGEITYPQMFGIGLSFLLKTNMSAGLEYSQTDWDQYTVNGKTAKLLQTARQIRAGIEWVPSLDSYAPYYKKILYRAGIAYTPLHVKDTQNQTIREIWGTFGFGLPLSQNQAHVDIAANYGIRGDLTENGIQENIWRFSISLTGCEKWFERKY